MKRKKLLKKMRALLSADQRAQLAKHHSLEKVLAKLAAKELAFREKLDAETDGKRRREIEHKLKVIAVQRKKGEALKREIEELRAAE